MLILVALIFFTLTTLITGFGYRHYVRPGRMLDQLKSTTSDAIPLQLRPPDQSAKSNLAKLLEPIGNLLPISPQDAQVAKGELTEAGFRSPSAVAIYYGVKISLAVLFLGFTLLFRDRLDSSLQRIFLPIGAAGFGFVAPSFVLSKKVKRRHQAIRMALPDVLDLMVICTEAGCGLDQAIMNVSRELKSVHPILSDELAMVNMEIMAGTTRADALRNLAVRASEDEIKKLVAILIQTDRFGTSITEALRTQSEFLRVRRKQVSEEKAGKVGVKLIFPIFFFCLPSLVVVTAGPGMLQLFSGFASMKP